MKYSNSNKPFVCMMTQSTCYKGTRKMDVKGILWHSTGVNNPTLKRYVQPDDNASNRATLLSKIGVNNNKNDWNHSDVDAGLNAWIGKFADGSIGTVQTMPWNYRPWGCGSGSKGSCNSGWIQFEICEDNLNDKTYFNKVYNEACELTAYLCRMYNLDPQGTTTLNGVKVPVILCHADSHKLGLGSGHADVYHWFNKYGVSMTNVRNDVAKILNQDLINNPRTLSEGMSGEDVKTLQKNLIKLGYSVGSDGADGHFGPITKSAVIKFQKDHKLDPDGYVGPLTRAAIEAALKALKKQIYRIRKSWKDAASQMGAYSNLDNAIAACKVIKQGYKVFDSNGKIMYDSDAIITPISHQIITVNYKIRVTADKLNVRATPSINGKYVTQIKKNEIYTIVQEQNGWGKLKSGAGWINLAYTKKL